MPFGGLTIPAEALDVKTAKKPVSATRAIARRRVVDLNPLEKCNAETTPHTPFVSKVESWTDSRLPARTVTDLLNAVW